MTDDELDIQKEIDSLSSMIKTPVDRAILEKELDRYMNRYLMDIESSKRAIVKDHGGSDYDYVPPAADECPISDVRDNTVCTIIAKVNAVNSSVTKGGKDKRTICAFDSSGIIPIEVWGKESGVQIGHVYRFRNCSIKYNSYHDAITATCDLKDISECDYSMDVDVCDFLWPLVTDSDEFIGGMKNRIVHGRILGHETKTLSTGSNKTITDILIDGSIYVMESWFEPDMADGSEVLIDRLQFVYSKYDNQNILKMSDISFIYRV